MKIPFKEWKAAQESIEIDFDSDSFVIPHPLTWPDSYVRLAEAGDNLALCKALIGGDEAYDRFESLGGSQAVIGALMAEHFGDLGK